MNKNYVRYGFILALIGQMLGCASSRTFYVGEHTDFDECGGGDLNSITPQFVDYLRDQGWKGHWFMEGNAWPQDHQEETIVTGGIDFDYGDAKNLSAYAGHGFTDPRMGLSYGTAHDSVCRVDIDRDVRLGETTNLGSNGEASFFFVMTSCTMHLPRMVEVWVNSGTTRGVAQVFGFHDSPAINNNEPRQFLQKVNKKSSRNNRTEWLNKMDNCGPWYWFCSNSPMVLTLGESQDHADDIHHTANLFHRHLNPTIDGPAWYFYSYRDNGNGPCE